MSRELLPSQEKSRLHSLFEYERKAFSEGFSTVAGVDEVGRGPLAGPVVAAACILPKDPLCFPYLNDSKKLSESRRESLYQALTSHPEVKIGVSLVSHEEIDQINILQATLKAMKMAVEKLPCIPPLLLVDGTFLPPYPSWKIVGGDALSLSIAAASVIAKVTRDRLMKKIDLEWPHYGFERNKGYGTKEHMEALKTHGPCPVHRKTFAPVSGFFRFLTS